MGTEAVKHIEGHMRGVGLQEVEAFLPEASWRWIWGVVEGIHRLNIISELAQISVTYRARKPFKYHVLF